MPKLSLNLEAIRVESFATATVEFLSRPTTTAHTNEPGCTQQPELCGPIVAI